MKPLFRFEMCVLLHGCGSDVFEEASITRGEQKDGSAHKNEMNGGKNTIRNDRNGAMRTPTIGVSPFIFRGSCVTDSVPSAKLPRCHEFHSGLLLRLQ